MLNRLSGRASLAAAALAAALALMAAPGSAQVGTGTAGIAPPAPAVPSDRNDRLLEAVNLAVVMPPEIGSHPANKECGVTDQLITNAVIGPVVGSGLRTERQAVAPPFTVNTPGVFLIPTVATLREGRYMCISWVALRAQSAQPVTMPSTGLFRNAQVLHWDRGILISSSTERHAEAVSSALQQLASAFGQQWRAEQR
jgi:hypothetical protein